MNKNINSKINELTKNAGGLRMMTGVVILVLGIILSVIVYEKGIPEKYSGNLQQIIGFCLALLFMYIIYSFSCHKDKILGYSFIEF